MKRKLQIVLCVIFLLLISLACFFGSQAFRLLTITNEQAVFGNFVSQQVVLERLSSNRIVFWTITGEETNDCCGEYIVCVRKIPLCDFDFDELDHELETLIFALRSNEAVLMCIRDQKIVSSEIGKDVFSFMKRHFPEDEQCYYPELFSELSDWSVDWVCAKKQKTRKGVIAPR